MIKEELFGQEWMEEETKEITFALKRFKVEDEDEQALKSPYYDSMNNLSSDGNHQVWKSLMSRVKGQKLSFEEKVYVYSKLKSNEHSKAHIMQKFGISYGTIMNIKKDFDWGITP